MPDTITQLQRSLDDLAAQMFASLRYIAEHHSNAQITGQQYLGPLGRDYDPQLNPTALPNGDTKPAKAESEQQPPSSDPPPLAQTEDDYRVADESKIFEEALREMSRDLVKKEKEMEALVEGMLGRDRSKEQQEERMRVLDKELSGVERELEEAGRVKEDLLKKVEGAIWKCNRY